jgi:hypothetical protein
MIKPEKLIFKNKKSKDFNDVLNGNGKNLLNSKDQKVTNALDWHKK